MPQQPEFTSQDKVVQAIDGMAALLEGWIGVFETADRAFQSLPSASQNSIESNGLVATEDMHLAWLMVRPEVRRQQAELLRSAHDALDEIRAFACGEEPPSSVRFGPDESAALAGFLTVLTSLGSRSRRQLRFFFDSVRQGDHAIIVMLSKGRKVEARALTKIPPEMDDLFGS